MKITKNIKSEIFHTGLYKTIELKIKNFINKYPDFLNIDTVGSTRATGDAIEHILKENFKTIISPYLKEFISEFSRRTMGDFAFIDKNDLYYSIDVSTHRLDTKFHMPNLTSVKRLADYYKIDNNYFIILIVKYYVINKFHLKVKKVHFIPIEFISWESLTLGNLGWGQIQIKSSKDIIINEFNSRENWMLEFFNRVLKFYYNEKIKINKRIKYFERYKNEYKDKYNNI